MTASLTLWFFAQAWAIAFIASLLLIGLAARHFADVVRHFEDVDRRRHVARVSVGEQPLGLFAAELDEIQGLPTIEPSWRWMA
jgi:hypothetical protein